MPDGEGYVILDKFGNVYKYGTATTGAIGAGSTPAWGVDIARDIVILSGYGVAFGYYVVDAWGGVFNTSGLPARTNPSSSLFRDRWRGVAIYGGRPLLVRNDGTTVWTN